MTLIKSILLGSAAGIVVVAGAQAADLPTHKAAPVQYVQICNVGGITGWTLPGSDTCVKFSGYITAQFTAGNLNTQYNWATPSIYTDVTGVTFPLTVTKASFPALLVAGSPSQQNTTFFRSDTGWTARSNFSFDMASNTAWGPLIGHFDVNVDVGNGFDSLTTATGGNTGGGQGNIAYLNTGYLTWAGLTAGKAASFFSFTGGGDNWANLFSPDRKGFNQPMLLAYTASFGGGFSATLSAESPGALGQSGGGTQITEGNVSYGGQRWPDIVGALHVKQPWGQAQISGVLHDVNVVDNFFYNAGGLNFAGAPIAGCGATATAQGTLLCNGQETKTGWALDAGVQINLPSFGAGDNFLISGAYSQSAVWYSGLPDGMWGENGQTNGNGQPMYLSDAYFNPITNTWATPKAWSVMAVLEHHFTPQFYVDLEGAVGGIEWNNQGGCSWTVLLNHLCPGGLAGIGGPLSPSATSWIIGADLGWNPVTNLNFDLELMYQSTEQERPNGVAGTIYGLGDPRAPAIIIGGVNTGLTGVFVPGAWEGNSSGFAGRFRITRYF